MRDKQTVMPLGDHAAHWSSYIGEVIRGVPLYYPSWLKVLKEWKAALITDIGGSRLLARLQDEMLYVREAGPQNTHGVPFLIDTFWRTHTVDGVFPKDEDRRIYEEIKRLEATGEYTKDEINRLARGGKLRGHIPGVGRVLPSRTTSRPNMFKEFKSGGASGSGGCGDDEESGDDEEGEDEDGDGESCVGPTSSLGIIAGDCIPDEVSPATIPQRHVAGDRFPQRHVAGERPDISLGKDPIVLLDYGSRISMDTLRIYDYLVGKQIGIHDFLSANRKTHWTTSSLICTPGQHVPPEALASQCLAWVKGLKGRTKSYVFRNKLNGLLADCERISHLQAGGNGSITSVKNFNMHGMGKTVNELHAMLKLHEETLPKKDANPALHAIRAGRVQKNQKNKPHKAAKRGHGKGKGKMGYAPNNAPFSPKPKTPPPPKKDNPAKDTV
ncbi:hypothetical protein Tco_0729821 [Tanacetum coccineum]|uniref:Uncharacterized protein n=1 Tax=Tanacetum coccineum TaxID=301880 RepID=A0ABQ4YQX7_9ASTR